MGRNRGFSPFFIYSQSRRKEVCQLSSSAARGVVQKDEYVDSRTFVKKNHRDSNRGRMFLEKIAIRRREN